MRSGAAAGASASSMPRSICARSARGTYSATISWTNAGMSSGALSDAAAASGSARASISNWLIRWAPRVALWSTSFSRAIRAGSSVAAIASAVWLFRPASGVRSWCAASAMKRFCAFTFWRTDASRAFSARTREWTSCGADSIRSGARSSGERPSTSLRRRSSGARPAPVPIQTMSVSSGISADSGSRVSIRISLKMSSRCAMLRATCTSIHCSLPSGAA